MTDPRSPPSGSPGPDPRLASPSVYNRDEIVFQLSAFYESLPHVSASMINDAPENGWPSISKSSLEAWGIHKTDEAIELLRHLPYLSGDEHAFVAPAGFACDYRIIGTADENTAPGWLWGLKFDDASWPAWVVQLTAGADREGACYMLDTTDGTVTRGRSVGFRFPPSYGEDDPRAWRDRLCDDVTLPLQAQLQIWAAEYRDLIYLAVPPSISDYACPGVYVRSDKDGPGSVDWDEIQVSDGLSNLGC